MTAAQHTITPPENMATLRRNRAGYLIPFFLADQKSADPDFTQAHPAKFQESAFNQACWVCGNPRDPAAHAFVLGPMCVINRVTAEPPSHPECAQYSVRVCPFLSRPAMTRRTTGKELNMPGVPILRNPGVSVIWTCTTWEVFDAGDGMFMFDLTGEPDSVTWWREGRPATMQEVAVSIKTGWPALMEHCQDDSDRAALAVAAYRAAVYLPTPLPL